MNSSLARVFLSSLLQRRLATALSLLAIALGVALGLAVQLIHGAALDEFGRGVRLLAGEADLQVIGPNDGFDEALYFSLAQRAEVAEASPLLELDARLPELGANLRVIGVDLFRVVRVQPMLVPVATGEGARMAALQADSVFLSDPAREALLAGEDADTAPGRAALSTGRLVVQSGLDLHVLQLAGKVPGAGQRLAVMDIAAAQQLFERLGRLTRIDLRLAAGVSARSAMDGLSPLLPAGVVLRVPEGAEAEAGALSRAYRVNMTMLAAIALLTGGFLVFSTQLLSVARRRREFALMRALGLTRGELMRGLLFEGGAVGLIGGVVGVALGHALAGLAFRLVGGDLGAGFFQGVQPALHFDPVLAGGYALLGVFAGLVGTWLPAREAARVAPARALRAGDSERGGLLRARSRTVGALLALVLAAALCLLPPVAGIALGGYLAVALILAAAVMALPDLSRTTLAIVGPGGRARSVVVRLAHARLAAAPGQAVVAGAGVLASVALASAMAIMVSSFRVSVDDWLAQVLPADLYVRASSSSASGYLDPAAVERIRAVRGVASIDVVRAIKLRLGPEQPVLTLLARPVEGGWGLPLVAGSQQRPALPGTPPAWISEAVADLQGIGPGGTLELPLAGQSRRFVVAGVWRDYARQHGAVVIEREDYVALSGDERVNDVAIRLAPGHASDEVADALRKAFGAQRLEIAQPGEIRAISLEIFDRTFLITYLMEAVAVAIGLFGVATTFAALATTRKGEFGMLRHLGLTRSDIGRVLALEGALTAGLGVLAGLLAGGAIAWVLIEVINRQSFHWSMDLSVPVLALGVFSAALIGLAAMMARLAGARAMRRSAVLAVKEDW